MVRNGIIFEYFNIRETGEEFRNRVFSFDSNDSYSIHSHYYFDMTDRNQERIHPFDFSSNSPQNEGMRIGYAILKRPEQNKIIFVSIVLVAK